jgi:hypothetical protein
MKVLLDTNIWISGLLWGGNPREIIQLAIAKKILLYSSNLLINVMCNFLQDLVSVPPLIRGARGDRFKLQLKINPPKSPLIS